MINQKGNIITIILISTLWLNPLGAQQLSDSLKLIDYHVHVFSKELVSNLAKQGYNLKNSRFQIIKNNDDDYSKVSAIIEDNKAKKMVLISTGYAYEGLKEYKFIKTENDLLAKMVKLHPKQLFGFYGINPLKEYAIKEIIRCNEELKLNGIKLHLQSSHLNLFDSLHLAKLKEVFALAEEKNIPLLIHNNAWDKSFGTTYFRLFQKEILNEFNGLTIIFAHVGGGGGFFKFGYDFLKAFNGYQKRMGNLNTHKIYFELSGVVKRITYPGEKPLKKLLFLMKEIGFEHFLFGSDYPVKSSQTYFKELQQLLKLDDSTLKRIVEKDIFSTIRN